MRFGIDNVISGGQTGVDQAALRAARASGIVTGGFAPKGWATEDGPAPWLGSEYGLVGVRGPRLSGADQSQRRALRRDDLAGKHRLQRL